MAETSWRKSEFLLAEFLPICTNYIVTTRDDKRSHSALDLPEKPTTRVDFFKTFTRPSKQPREDLENTPATTINSPSTSYSNNQGEKHEFDSSGNHSKKAEYLAFKLDKSQGKVVRYNSHMLFLEKWIMENVISNGLKLDLQPTIGNHDIEFLPCWYGKPKTFSKEFIKGIANF